MLSKEKHHLPYKTVIDILHQLGDIIFQGEIGFHLYNEPLIDPRLFNILDHACRWPVRIWTNGIILSNDLKKELENMNVQLIITDHKKCELDSRLNIYDWEPIEPKKCLRTHQLTIDYTGEVIVCCYDWKRTVSFGNVKKEHLKDIIKRIPEVREYDICRRCANWTSE